MQRLVKYASVLKMIKKKKIKTDIDDDIHSTIILHKIIKLSIFVKYAFYLKK